MILIPILILLAINLLTVVITKRKFGTVLPLTIFLICFLIFASQCLFSTFQVAFWILCIASVASLGYLIYALIEGDMKRKELKANFFSTGFFTFLIIAAILFAINYFSNYVAWDNFSHWGPMLKEMLRLDKFYSVPEAVIPFHKDYPPMAGIFELFFVRFTGFHEGTTIFAISILQFSLVLPLVEKLAKQKLKILKASAFVLLLIFATIFIDQHGIIGSIYIDYLIAFLAAFSLYLTIFEKLDRFNIFYIITTILFMSFIKEVALVLTGVIAITFFARKIMERGKKHFIKKLLVPALFCIVALIGFGCWKFIIRNTESERQFDLSKLSPSTVLCSIRMNCPEEWRNATTINYTKAIFTRNITTSYVELSFAQELVLIAVIYYLIYRKLKKTKDNQRSFRLLCVSYFIGAAIYVFAMFMIYTSLFVQSEGEKLASFNRYMNTYSLIGLVLAVLYLIRSYSENSKSYNLFLILLIAVILQSPTALTKLFPLRGTYQEMSYCKSLNETLPEEQPVIVAYRDLSAYNRIRYCTVPYSKNFIEYHLGDDKQKTVEELRSLNKPFLLLDATDEEKTLIENTFNIKEVKNGTLYEQ